jgi:hypothetical protein
VDYEETIELPTGIEKTKLATHLTRDTEEENKMSDEKTFREIKS